MVAEDGKTGIGGKQVEQHSLYGLAFMTHDGR
jgi:hypothetical protein